MDSQEQINLLIRFVVKYVQTYAIKATVFITIDSDINCEVPNIITPNGDGLNDSFIVPCVDFYSGSRLLVFNRWGDEIYRDDDYKNDWSGTYQGDNLPVGSYFFMLTINNSQQTTYNGYVYIQRN